MDNEKDNSCSTDDVVESKDWPSFKTEGIFAKDPEEMLGCIGCYE